MLRLPGTSPPVRDQPVSAVAPVLAVSTHEARLAAEQAFQKGMALLRATNTVAAALELRRASLLQPESLEYALCASWAEARSRSEIPSEADQRTLLEIAQRAKKRDPMFAFGSYVLGQLAMWAGDDAAVHDLADGARIEQWFGCGELGGHHGVLSVVRHPALHSPSRRPPSGAATGRDA